MLLRFGDPSVVGLRKARKPNDLEIGATNNWTVGFDNVSVMSYEMADTLCMVATGISLGGRKLYTNDEEHVFTVQRPVLFNGIPGDLTQRGDFASRVIRLAAPRITKRRTEHELEEEFESVWPEVLGALLDGLVGAIAGWRDIEVENPARLIDFERWAEAGCRAMGFEEWEFVEAYRANRLGLMATSLEASPVGRAVMTFLKKKPQGFRGKMSLLHKKIESFKDIHLRHNEWPIDATRLSTALSRIAKPLEVHGITYLNDVDRRSEGGTQHDVVLEWAALPATAEVVPFRRRV
jgi:hypothetical protein